MSKMWMPSKPAPTGWPPHVCVLLVESQVRTRMLPQTTTSPWPDVMGALLVVAELHGVRRIGGVDDAEAVPVALDDEVALEGQVGVDGGEAGPGHVAGREADRRHVVAVGERSDGGADRIGRGGRLDVRVRALPRSRSASSRCRPAPRRSAGCPPSSSSRRSTGRPSTRRWRVAHGCALAAAGSSAIAIAAIARLTRPTIPLRCHRRPPPRYVALSGGCQAPNNRGIPGTGPAGSTRGVDSSQRSAPASIARVIARPPLPPGPLLVVGLARSGVAAALALRARGAEVVGCDAHAVGDEVRADAGGRRASPSTRRRTGSPCWSGRRPWSRAPACRRRRRWWSPRGGAARAWSASWRSAGGCWPTTSSRSRGPTARRPRPSSSATSIERLARRSSWPATSGRR